MLLILGAGLAVMLTWMLRRDAEIRENNIDLIKSIGKKLAQEATGSPGVLFETAPKRRFLRGGLLCVSAFLGLIILDIIAAVTFRQWFPHAGAPKLSVLGLRKSWVSATASPHSSGRGCREEELRGGEICDTTGHGNRYGQRSCATLGLWKVNCP